MHFMFHRLAIKHLSEIDGWSMEQLIAIIDKAKIVWSQSANDWDKDQVSELGKVLSKLFMCLMIDLQLRLIPANKNLKRRLFDVLKTGILSLSFRTKFAWNAFLVLVYYHCTSRQACPTIF